MDTGVRHGARVVLPLLLAVVLFGCSFTDWGDDHLVINELSVLGDNDAWTQIRDVPAEPVDCSFATCQNVLRGVLYELVGDVGQARADALTELMLAWVPVSDVDPFAEDTVLFELRDDIEIDTTTGTAFLRARFAEDVQIGADEFVANALSITLSSDDEI